MTITTINDPRFSDVLLQEKEGYGSREKIVVNMSTGATLGQFTVLARAKSASLTAPYDIVKAADVTNSATALDKEFAILVGDSYSLKESVTFVTTTAKEALAIVRDARLKETPVLAIHDAALSDAEWGFLKGALQKQEILIEKSAAASA